MTLVKIVYVPDADRRGPDLDRIGGIEDIDPDLARVMVGEGSAVYVDETTPTPALPPVGPSLPIPTGTPVPTPDDLAGLTRDELLALAAERGLPVTARSTKADLVAALTPQEPAGDSGGEEAAQA